MTALELLNSKGRVYAMLWTVQRETPGPIPMETLAPVTGLQRESVRRAVRHLQKEGLVRTEPVKPGKPLKYYIVGTVPGLACGEDGSPLKVSVFE